MHALRHVHKLLVPGGTLVELRPVTEDRVETSTGTSVGVIEEPEFMSVDLPNTEACMQAAIEDRLYALEMEIEFDVLKHFDGIEELIEEKEEHLAAQPSLVRLIRAATPPLVTRAHVVLRRLRAT